MTTHSLSELQTALDKCRADGFVCFVSIYGPNVHVTLNKYATSTSKLSMKVEAEGATMAEAFEQAFANFPSNPLDGATKWHDPRLAAPITEGEFNEIPLDGPSS